MGLMLNNQPIKGEVHLGKQTIGKMYYNHELVYENMLASGTVLWSGSITGGGGRRFDLKGVTSKPNIKGIVIHFNDQKVSLTNSQLNHGYEQKYSYEILFVIMSKPTSQTYIYMEVYPRTTITKITAL